MVLLGRFFAILSGGVLLTIMGFWDERVLQVVLPYYGTVFSFALLTYFLSPRARQVEVERRYDPVMSVRVPNVVILRVRNAGQRPIKFRLREELPPPFQMERREFSFHLDPGEQKEARYHVVPGERGDFYFRNSVVRVEAPLGLVARQEVLPTARVVRVFPNVLALREFELLKQRGHLRQMGIRRSRLKGLGTDFESLREYTVGDDYRRIEWKATARKGKVIVKEMEAERNQPVILIIDYGRLMMAEVDGVQKLDYILDASLLLGNAVVGAHDLLGLLLFADHVERWLPPGKGRRQLGKVIEALHALRAQPLEPNSSGAFSYLARHWKRRSLLVVFTELEDSDSAQELLRVLGPLTRTHLCLVVTVADPRLKAQRKASLDSPEGIYLRTAARLYEQQRGRARALLEQGGVNVLDAEPEELGTQLVNHYIRIKTSATL
jgi:uncharacterized protein (DUF58 family)